MAEPAFLRNQSSTERMSQHRYEQIMVSRGQLNHTWETITEDNSTLSHLDHDRIHYLTHTAIKNRRVPASASEENLEDILSRYKLMQEGKLNRAATVLFGKHPQNHYPQCIIKMARFKGSDKLGHFIDNQRAEGNVFDLIDAADAFLLRHLPIASFFDDNQLQRIDKPAIPIFPIREALVNAICYRNYAQKSGSISLSIYDDRIEIWNNGSLPNNLTIEDLSKNHQSWPTNPIIANVFTPWD